MSKRRERGDGRILQQILSSLESWEWSLRQACPRASGSSTPSTGDSVKWSTHREDGRVGPVEADGDAGMSPTASAGKTRHGISARCRSRGSRARDRMPSSSSGSGAGKRWGWIKPGPPVGSCGPRPGASDVRGPAADRRERHEGQPEEVRLVEGGLEGAQRDSSAGCERSTSTTPSCNAYVSHRLALPRTRGTVRVELATLRRAFNLAAIDGKAIPPKFPTVEESAPQEGLFRGRRLHGAARPAARRHPRSRRCS